MKTNIQAIRKRAGFKSAKEFAEHIGMNVKTYTNYEQGTANMTLEKAWELADALDCSLDELAGRDFSYDKDEYDDPLQQELNDNYLDCTEERKSRLVVESRDYARLSKNDAERTEHSADEMSA